MMLSPSQTRTTDKRHSETPRMAKPQTEEGFVMIALDLFVAIMTCDLPNREAIILAEILTQSYGPAKRRNVVIDPATIEDITGLHRNNVRRALVGLVEANIIARNEDGGEVRTHQETSERPNPGGFSHRITGQSNWIEYICKTQSNWIAFS
jgi:phage replication O-like protein O